MRSAFTSTELNILRKRPQSAVWRLAIHRPASLCRLAKSATIQTHPASAFLGDMSIGTSGLVKSGQTVWFSEFGNGGSDQGIARVRRSFAPATSALQIAESGSGLINWNNVFYATIMDEYRPWIKHPRYDTSASQWRMDYDEIDVGQMISYGPLAQMGPPVIGFLSSGSFAASFVGNRSQSMGSSGSAITASSWVFPDGQMVTSLLGTSNNPVVMTFTGASPNGAYFSLTVQDAAGASHIGRRLIYLFSDETQPARVNFASIQGGILAEGYKTSIQAMSASAGESAFPKGTEIAIFESASYNDSASTIGGNYPHRANTLFRGWITDEVVRVNPFTSDTLFNAQTINGVMQQAEAYDVFHDLANPPTGASHWIEAANLSLDRTAWDMLKNRSTVGDIVDFTPASGIAVTEQIEYQSLPRAGFWTQLNQNYKERGVLGYVAADLQSNIYAFADSQVTGGSANLPTVMQVARGDRRDTVQIVSQHRDRNAQVKMYAVASVTPLGGESPGTVQGYFGGRQEQQRGLLTTDQDTLITWSGNLRAKLNNEFERVVVPLSGNIRLDPVPQSMVSMSLSPTDNSRRLNWSNKNFLPHTLQLDYDSVSRTVKSQIEMEAVVNGIGGSAITFPTVSQLVPPPTPTPTPNPTPTVPPAQGTGFGTVYVATDTELIRTRDFSATSPVWVDITPAAIGGKIRDFILDPFRPSTTGYIAANDGIYKSSDLDVASPSWTLVLSAATAISNIGGTFNNPCKIIASINYDGYVGFGVEGGASFGDGFYYVYTTDGGATWNYSQVVATGGRTYIWMGGLDYVPHLVGGNIRLYLTLEWSDGGGTTPQLFRSDNSGASWSLIDAALPDGGANSGGVVVHCPYNNNESGNTVYYQGTEPDNSLNILCKSTNAGVSRTVIDLQSVVAGTHTGGTYIPRTGIESYTQDENRLYVFLGAYAFPEVPPTLLTSDNGGTSWSIRANSGLANAGAARATGGFPYVNSQFYLSAASGVFVSTDRGDSWVDKTGNWTPTSTGSGNGAIVPLWTE